MKRVRKREGLIRRGTTYSFTEVAGTQAQEQMQMGKTSLP
jgi:hypothetical protein